MRKLSLIAAIALTLCTAALAQNTSVYTRTASCKTIESSSKEGGYYRGRCAGVGGYKLELEEGDIRQTLNVITPGKKKFKLNFWQYNGNFSYVGDKLEWRLRKGVPVALIARFNTSDSDNSEKTHSFLVVSKVGRKESCVIEIIDPVAKQNEKARASADAAPGKPCLALPN
ncbi:MAG TPA: hypothetical protein VGI80_00805 [Pyrinomonadaceae bacterium]